MGAMVMMPIAASQPADTNPVDILLRLTLKALGCSPDADTSDARANRMRVYYDAQPQVVKEQLKFRRMHMRMRQFQSTVYAAYSALLLPEGRERLCGAARLLPLGALPVPSFIDVQTHPKRPTRKPSSNSWS